MEGNPSQKKQLIVGTLVMLQMSMMCEQFHHFPQRNVSPLSLLIWFHLDHHSLKQRLKEENPVNHLTTLWIYDVTLLGREPNPGVKAPEIKCHKMLC